MGDGTSLALNRTTSTVAADAPFNEHYLALGEPPYAPPVRSGIVKLDFSGDCFGFGGR